MATTPQHTARAFTLIELLVVISIMGILAGFILGVSGTISKNKKISTARAELAQIGAALENYKAKYGVYPPGNQNPASGSYTPQLLNQLFYELSGVTVANTGSGPYFTTLDGAWTIPQANYASAYGAGGVMNCTKGSGEDMVQAQNFLLSLSTKQYYNPVTNSPSANVQIPTTILVTSVGGPDTAYMPLNASDLNPIRYASPNATNNNPGSYDLWVQLSISGKHYLVCNWSKNAQVNTSFP